MDTLLVEKAVEEDIARILEIELEAISPPWTHGALLAEIYREDSFFAVARCGSRFDEPGLPALDLQGFVIVRRTGDDGELLQIAVDKRVWRQGVADMLMLEAIGFAKNSSLNSVFLEVRKSNEAAVSLYKKHGYKPVRTRKDYYSSPVEDAVVMVLLI